MTKRLAWHPAKYEKEDIRAIQALAIYARAADVPPLPGEEPPTLSPADARRALDWIVKTAAATYDEPFEAGQPDVVNYLLGRRSVGLAIVKLISLKPEVFKA
jgi:hypothetical protein